MRPDSASLMNIDAVMCIGFIRTMPSLTPDSVMICWTLFVIFMKSIRFSVFM